MCFVSINIFLLNFCADFLNKFLFSIETDPPVISLELGSKLQPGDIKEGDDVYFECKIESNPKFRKLQWLHNVSKYSSEYFI